MRSGHTRMADEPFVDTHIHFFDKSYAGLQWAWLEPGFSFRKWTFDEAIDSPRYGPTEFRAEAASTGLAGAVHVHCADPLPEPAVETAWIDSLAAASGWPQAQVGRCDLDAPDAAATIMAESASPLFRGIRDPFSAKRLDADIAAPAMDALAAIGASLEVRRHHNDFAVVDELATRWPTVPILLSHGCLPLERTPDEHAAWSAAIRSLAHRPNVACKISTVVGASQPEPRIELVRPWILSCVEAFGADRCMLASNFPIDRPYVSYGQLVDLYRESVAELSVTERQAILAETAARLYEFELVVATDPIEGEPS
jgi:predicted TIM-barrel fold metal-dependent hydrolase